MKRTIVIFGTVLILLSGVLYFAPRPQQADTVALLLDASGSVGLDYANRYVPVASKLIGSLSPGTRLNVVRFGGRREVVYDGNLQPDIAVRLQQYLLSTGLFPPTVRGSPITVEAANQLTWLQQQSGRRKVLVMFTDGIEQDTRTVQLPANKLLNTTVICCSKTSSPKVAEYARLAGARVIVAQTPQAVHKALATEVLGQTPLTRLSPWLSMFCLLAGLTCLAVGFYHSRSRHAESAQAEEFTPISSPATAQPRLELPTKRVEVMVQLVGHPQIRCQRVLRCNGIDRLIIARSDMPDADLRLPPELLGNAADVGVMLQIQEGQGGLLMFHIKNFGKVPIVANKPVMPNAEVVIPSTGELRLMLGPRASLQISAKPIYEEVLVNDALHEMHY